MKRIISILFIVAIATLPFFAEIFKTNVEASYYADKFHGRMTANGEIFNMNDFTAAHKTLPFNTVIKVTNLANGKTVKVRINDRGPYVQGREIDLSKAAAEKLDMLKSGTANVSIEIIKMGNGEHSKDGKNASGNKNTQKKERYDIQLASYKSNDYAKAFATRLKEAGFSKIAYQTSGEIIRVVIHDLSYDETQSTIKKLEKKGFNDHLVKKINP